MDLLKPGTMNLEGPPPAAERRKRRGGGAAGAAMLKLKVEAPTARGLHSVMDRVGLRPQRPSGGGKGPGGSGRKGRRR